MTRTESNYCSSCGNQLATGSSYCSGCGNSVNSNPSQADKLVGNFNVNLSDNPDKGFPVWLAWIAFGAGIFAIVQGLLELL